MFGDVTAGKKASLRRILRLIVTSGENVPLGRILRAPFHPHLRGSRDLRSQVAMVLVLLYYYSSKKKPRECTSGHAQIIRPVT